MSNQPSGERPSAATTSSDPTASTPTFSKQGTALLNFLRSLGPDPKDYDAEETWARGNDLLKEWNDYIKTKELWAYSRRRRDKIMDDYVEMELKLAGEKLEKDFDLWQRGGNTTPSKAAEVFEGFIKEKESQIFTKEQKEEWERERSLGR